MKRLYSGITKSKWNYRIKLKINNQGFVSIFSVLIIMAILTLIMIGFSNVTRRSQQQTLDDQLNTQAYYAAESGINEAQTYLVSNPDFTKTDCQSGNPPGVFSGYNNGLDATLNVGYTCLLISEALDDVQINEVPLTGIAAAKVFPFESSTDAPAFFDITLSSSSGATTVPTTSSFPNILVPTSDRAPSDVGVLRVDLVPTTSYDRVSLITGGYTFFVYFSTAGNVGNQLVSPGTAGQGNLVFARCIAGSTACTTTIQLDLPAATTYMMRLSSIYSPVRVVIKNLKNISNGSLQFQNGQKIIDVTGKANDVFRRVQVRMSKTVPGLTSTYALQTADSVCKRLEVKPSNTTPDTVGLGDPACRIDN